MNEERFRRSSRPGVLIKTHDGRFFPQGILTFGSGGSGFSGRTQVCLKQLPVALTSFENVNSLSVQTDPHQVFGIAGIAFIVDIAFFGALGIICFAAVFGSDPF